MNNENSQAQAKSHAGGNDKLGINFAWPYEIIWHIPLNSLPSSPQCQGSSKCCKISLLSLNVCSLPIEFIENPMIVM